VAGFQLRGRQKALHAVPFHHQAALVGVYDGQNQRGFGFLQVFRFFPNHFLLGFL